MNDQLIVDGYIETLKSNDENSEINSETHNVTTLKMEDIYQDLRIKGYHYENQFRTLFSSNLEGKNFQILIKQGVDLIVFFLEFNFSFFSPLRNKWNSKENRKLGSIFE